MISQKNKLNITLSVIIVFLVIYFINFNNEYETNIIKEGNVGRRIRRTVRGAVKPLKKQIKLVEKKMDEKLNNTVKNATRPITNSINNITEKISSITSKLSSIANIVTNVINGIKSGIVKPIRNAFKHIGRMFSQLGLLILDFLLQIAQIPTCILSYITWIFVTLKDQIITTIILPIIENILKSIFGRFYPETIVSYFINLLNWFINIHFYILSAIGSLLGIKKVFYKDKCFDFTGNFTKRINKMKKHLRDAGNSFSDFGKFQL